MRQPKQVREYRPKKPPCPDCGEPWAKHGLTFKDGKTPVWKCPDD